jgi:hypothetical protein
MEGFCAPTLPSYLLIFNAGPDEIKRGIELPADHLRKCVRASVQINGCIMVGMSFLS